MRYDFLKSENLKLMQIGASKPLGWLEWIINYMIYYTLLPLDKIFLFPWSICIFYGSCCIDYNKIKRLLMIFAYVTNCIVIIIIQIYVGEFGNFLK